MKKFLFLLLAIVFAMQSWAQSTIVIADGTATNSYLPVYGYYMDVDLHSQFIYPAADAGALTGALISKVQFHTSSTTYNSAWGSATCVVSIGTPTETNFPTAAFNSTPLTQVYSGPISVVNGVMEFTFTTPYLFSGGNLMFDITTLTGGDYLSSTFLGVTASNGGYFLYASGGGVQQFLPKATFEYTGGTPVAITSNASSVNATSATLNGAYFNMTSTNYGFQYMLDASTDWTTATTVTATTNPMTEIISSLTPNTIYRFRAFANDGTTNIYGIEKTFTTLALPAYLPYSCDFENPTENNEWAYINGTQANQWVIGDATLNPDVNNSVGGINGLFISNDAGLTYAYSGASGASPSRVYAYRDIEVPLGTNELKLTIDWKANGFGYGDLLRVYWVPTDAVITAGSIPPGALDISNALGTFYNNTNNNIQLNLATTWQTNEFVINTIQFPTLAGNTWRLLIHWRNENTSGVAQPPATIDNISLIAVACATPTLVTASNATINSVDLAWTENGTATTWNVEYKKSTETTWQTVVATTNPYTVTGLDASSVYNFRVQADCSSEVSMFSSVINMATACASITTLPWEEGFEAITATNELPPCWTSTSLGNYTYTQISNYGSYNRNARTGTKCAYFRYGSNDRFYTVGVNLTAGVSYDFSYWYVTDTYSGWNTLQSGVYSAQNPDSLIQIIQTINNPINGTYLRSFGSFIPTVDGTYYFAIYCNSSYSPMYLTIDDIKVDVSPSCLGPVNPHTQNITPYAADILFSPGDATTVNYQIFWKEASATTWNQDDIFNDTTYQLTTLTPSTVYNVKVVAECSDLTYSEPSSIITFTTACIPISVLPWNDSFESITVANQLPPCWASTSINNYTYTQTTNYGSYNRNARTGTCAAYFRYGCNDRFFTPGLQLTAGVAYKFSYWYVTDGYTGWTSLQAGAYSSQNAGSLIQTLNTVTDPTNNTYQEVVCYFTPTADGVYYFGIYCQSTYNPYYLTLDDISVDLAPDCLPVQQMTVTDIVGTSAFVSWIQAGTPDYYTVAYSPAGQNTWTTYTTTTNYYVLTGLTELTAYDVQVYPNCSGVDGPADTVSFTTICAAGGNLFIGTPNATTSNYGNYLPSELCYNYSYTQQIFDAAEVTTDTISNIAFQYFYTSSDTRKLKIYLGHTTQSTFTGISNYIPFDSLTQVFDGNVSFNNSGIGNWVTINLNTPFAFDGVRNLVLAVRDTTGTYTVCAETFRTHSTTGSKALYFYQDASAINPVSPSASSSGVVSYRNNIKISLPCEVVTCYAPNVILTDITSSSATMIIVPGASETSWEGEYKEASAATWTSLGTVTTSPFTLPALASNTSYQVRFRTVCSVSDMSSWKMVAFTTDCGTIATLPFTENFDSYAATNNNIPTCWTRVSTSGSYPYVYSYNSLSNPNSLYFYSSSSSYSMIVLPPVDPTIPLNTLQLTLWGRNYSTGQNIKIGVMTNPNDASTFTLMGTFTPITNSVYEEYIVSFANYIDTGVYIAIKSDNMAQSLSNEFYIDNLSLDLIPSCSKPLDIVFSSITTTSATASWDGNPTALSYEVVYGLPGVDPATATPIPVTDTFFVMTPLTATTLYDFYVRSVCSGGEFSEWTTLRTFSTVALAPVPYTEGFTSSSIPVGYSLTSFYVGSGSYVPGNPPNNLMVNLYSYTSTANFKTINIGPLVPNYELDFEYKLATYSGGAVVPAGSGNFIVAISTDWGDTYTNVDTVENNGLAGYQTYSFDLAAYDTQIIKIKVTGNWISNDYYLGIDNIYVGPAITCPFPNALTSNNATQTSVDLTWTENGTATEWQVEYGPVGFTQGSGTFVSANTNTSFVISGLTATTCYDAYVRSICGVGDTSIWSTKTTACTAQIPANVPVTFDFETPSGFQFANNASGNNWYIGTATNNTTGGQNAMYISNDNGVTNAFNNTTPVVVWAYRDVMFTASTVDYVLTFDWKGLAESCCDYLNVYIGDVVTPASSTSSTINAPTGSTAIATNLNSQTTWQTVTYTLPAATYSGQVKRIFFAWKNDTSLGDNPPAAVDNISINVSSPICAVPTNLAVAGITSSTATATWTAGGTETQWEIAYKPTAASTWNTAFTVAPTYALPSLTAATAYDVKVRAICGAGDTSAYTAIVNFNTLTTSCPAPTNLAATAITTTGATITWTPGGSETAWELDYKLASASTWTTIGVTAPTHIFTTLTPSTAYNVRVRAICGAGNNSDYSAIVNFTTATPPCLIPTNVLVPTATITDQSAVVTWTAAVGQTQWQVEYKLVSSANWTTMPISTATTQPIVALQSNSTYEVRIKALCSATNESPFTTPVQFTTTGSVTYTVTATASGPGTISPAGTVIVAAGANQTFTFTPTGSATINGLLVDNATATYTNNEYTFSNVLANHTISVSFTNSIDENGLAKLVELYPNPTNATIEIRLNETQLQVKECRVYDIYGKLMSIVPVNADNTKIDVTDFAAGVYFIRMNSEMGVITKKFVKK